MRRIFPTGFVALSLALLTMAVVPADAQPRRRVHVVRISHAPQIRVHVGGWYGSGLFYPWGWGWGGSPWFYPPYYYRDATASVRVQVEPKSAEVYVDGHLAGMVDDFDGFFQRLPIEAGGHEITVYKEGFRSYTERLYLRVGQSYGMRRVLEPLAAGEPNEPRPMRTAAPPPGPPDLSAMPMPPGAAREPVEPERQPPPEPRQIVPSSFGQIAIRVQPLDAEILIDDEPWRGPQGADRLVVHVRPGVHRIEVRKEGFDPFVTSIDVKKGEAAVLNVSLGRLSGV